MFPLPVQTILFLESDRTKGEKVQVMTWTTEEIAFSASAVVELIISGSWREEGAADHLTTATQPGWWP